MGNHETARPLGGRAMKLGLLRGRAVKALAVGALVVSGGSAAVITAAANTGHVEVSQDCSTWSAKVFLGYGPDHGGVSPDRKVTVAAFGTTVVDKSGYDTTGEKAPHQIWSDSGAAPKSGTVTLTIKRADGSTEYTDTKSLTPPSQCTAAITTTPSGASVPMGTAIHDVAKVSGTVGRPAGSVTFKLYGAGDDTCKGSPSFTSTAATLGNGSGSGESIATGDSFTPSAAGTYHWVATYAPDGNTYKAASSACADEPVTVSQAGPAITTVAATDTAASVGSPIHDTATVSGRVNPLSTGTVTFKLFGAGDTACAAAPVQTSTVPLPAGSDSVASPNFTTTAAGTYSYEASYSGDANNAAANSACGAANEAVVIGGGGGVQGITTPGGVQGITTPATGNGTSVSAVTVGGFLLLGGLGVALVGLLPKRRSSNS